MNLAAVPTSNLYGFFVGFATVLKWVVPVIAFLWALMTYVLTRNAAVYANFDELYAKILEIALEYPEFRTPGVTANYLGLSGSQRAAYETYAYLVFNVCETIADGLDLYMPPRKQVLSLVDWIFGPVVPLIADRKLLRKTWKPVLVAEKRLHRAWLSAQEGGVRFKREFLELMRSYDD